MRYFLFSAAVSAALALHKSNAWIGLRWNGKFYWVDESELQYTNWGTGEPNNQDNVIIHMMKILKSM